MCAFLAGTVVVIALAVAGCGGGGGDAAERLLNHSVNAAESARSVHLTGRLHGNAQLDMTIVRGKGAKGSITDKGQTAEVVIVGTHAYQRAGAAFWAQALCRAGCPRSRELAGKWIESSTTDPEFKIFALLSNLTSFLHSQTSGFGRLVASPAAMWNGRMIHEISDTATRDTFFVEATGTPYPFRLDASNGTFRFDKWNAPATVAPPSGPVFFHMPPKG